MNKRDWVFAIIGVTVLVLCPAESRSQPSPQPTSSGLVTTHYDWYPSTPLSLGLGFSPQNMFTPFLDCLTFTAAPPANPNISQDTELSITLVGNTDSLKAHLGVDYRAEASFFGIGSSDLSANVSINDTSESQNIALVISAVSYFPQQEATNLALKTQYGQLLNSSNPQDQAQFAQMCGTQYVKSVDRQVALRVIINLRQQSSSTVSQVRGSGLGGMDLGIVSGNAKLDISKEMTEISSSRTDDILVYAKGASLANLYSTVVSFITANPTDLTGIAQSLGALLASMNTPVDAGYNMRPMTDFLSTAPQDVFTQAKWDAAESIADKFREVKQAETEINSILGPDDLRTQMMSRADIANLRAQLPLYAPYEASLQATYHACLAGSITTDCMIPVTGAPDLSIVPLPFILGPIDVAIPAFDASPYNLELQKTWPGTNFGDVSPQEWRVGIDTSTSSAPGTFMFSIQRIDSTPPGPVADNRVLPFSTQTYSWSDYGKSSSSNLCSVYVGYADITQPGLGFYFFGDLPAGNFMACGGKDIRYYDVYGILWQAIAVRTNSTSVTFAKRRFISH